MQLRPGQPVLVTERHAEELPDARVRRDLLAVCAVLQHGTAVARYKTTVETCMLAVRTSLRVKPSTTALCGGGRRQRHRRRMHVRHAHAMPCSGLRFSCLIPPLVPH